MANPHNSSEDTAFNFLSRISEPSGDESSRITRQVIRSLVTWPEKYRNSAHPASWTSLHSPQAGPPFHEFAVRLDLKDRRRAKCGNSWRRSESHSGKFATTGRRSKGHRTVPHIPPSTHLEAQGESSCAIKRPAESRKVLPFCSNFILEYHGYACKHKCSKRCLVPHSHL